MMTCTSKKFKISSLNFTLNMSTVPFTSTELFQGELFQGFLGNIPPRKLLLQKPINNPQQILSPSPPPFAGEESFESNVFLILLVLSCALICSTGLASIIKCTLRCSRSSSPSVSSSNYSSSNTGIKQKALKTFTVVKYSKELSLPGLDAECVICLSEFKPDERVRLLPKCNHGFHVRCIDKWLRTHSSCPKCRHCLIKTCQKIMGCSQDEATSSSATTTAVQENPVSVILPLEPEAMVRNYGELS